MIKPNITLRHFLDVTSLTREDVNELLRTMEEAIIHGHVPSAGWVDEWLTNNNIPPDARLLHLACVLPQYVLLSVCYWFIRREAEGR